MQSSDILDESPIVKELSNVASQAFHELEITKQSLKEKELELIEIAEISNQKIHAAVKTNQDLQNKVQILMDFSNTLETKNKELEQKNHELKEQLLNVSKTEKGAASNLQQHLHIPVPGPGRPGPRLGRAIIGELT